MWGGRAMRRFAVLGCLLAGFIAMLLIPTACGKAERMQLAEARSAYDRQDYGAAYKLYAPLAEKGNAQAQLALAFMYHLGQGVPRDDAEAFRWVMKAAEGGDAGAQYNLAASYAEGSGVAPNVPAAMEWFYKAGLGFVKEGKQDKAYMALNAIEKYSPGNPLAGKL